jgi:hypothetical protein
MLTVKGESPETVQLPDLNDFIYYKQVKTFSEEEYKKSNSLQRAISKGSVIVLKRVDERFSSFEIPKSIDGSSEGSSDTNALMDLLKSIESRIGSSSQQDSGASLDILLQKIEALESKLQNTGSSDSSSLLDTIRKLEEKVNQTTNNPAFQRLEDLLSKISGSIGKDAQVKESDPGIQEEIYVPNIKVEDGNSHINLKVRTIEKSGGIDSALEALKKIKKQST